MQDHIGLHLAPRLVVLQGASHLVSQTSLHLIVDTLCQSLTRQQVTEDDLTHVTAHLIVAPQHVGQALRLLTQLLCLLHHLLDLFTERSRVGSTLLLVLRDGFLHLVDSLPQRLGNTRHRLRVLRFQFLGTALHQLLGHVLKALLVAFQFLVHLLAHQFQLPALALRLGMQFPVFRFQMVYPTRGDAQLFAPHREFDILLAGSNVHRIHPLVHHEVCHHSTHRDTYYYI